MKKIILPFVLALVGLLACKKDEAVDVFAKTTLTDIKAHEADLSASQLIFSEAGVQKIKPGAIIFYKNTDGVFGKLKIVSIGKTSPEYLLKIDLVNYNADGTVLLEKKAVAIRAGYYCDLKLGVEANGTLEDVGWLNLQDANLLMEPTNGALFYLFN